MILRVVSISVLVTLLSACGNDRLTGSYEISGHCPSHFTNSPDEQLHLDNGEVVDNNRLSSYQYVADDRVQFLYEDQEVYIGDFTITDHDNYIELNHNSGGYVCELFSS